MSKSTIYLLDRNFLFYITLFLSVLVFSSQSFANSEISVNNSSTYLGKGLWKWEIYIDEDHETIQTIDCVRYFISPFFPDEEVKECKKESKFAYSNTARRPFKVKLHIIFSNSARKDQDYLLVFKDKKAEPQFNELRVVGKSKQIKPGWWEWWIYIEGKDALLDKIRCVEYKLHKTFRDPLKMICNRSNKFELRSQGWGTFPIPIKVLINDGSILHLDHLLEFK